MRQFLVQVIAFTVVGAVAYGLAKLLRCRLSAITNLNARWSSVRALVAVGVSMAVLWLLMLHLQTSQAPESGNHLEFKTAPDLFLRILAGLIIYVLPAGYCLWRAREPLSSAGLGRHNLWQACAIGLLLGALMCCNRPATFAAKLSNLGTGQWSLLIFFSMVGFGEEFLFRGYLQTRLVARLGLGRGWILTALIFSLIHLPQRLVTPGTGIGDAAAATLGLLPVSLLLGFIMLRVQNVVAPGLFHTFANWASEVL